jgi:cytochrome P450
MRVHTSRNHVLTRFDECTFVLSHPESFSVKHASYPGAEEIRGRRGVQLIDGVPHQRLHSFLTNYFASGTKELRKSIFCPSVAAVIRNCSKKSELECLTDFAAPLSLQIIAAVLGLPGEDAEFITSLAEWRDSMTPWVATRGESTKEREHAVAAASRLREAAMPTIRARKSVPRDDLVTALWSVVPSIFPDCTEDDIFDQCRIMLLAGSDGVARLISTIIHLAMDAPTLRSELIAKNRQVTTALIEHACRLYPPAQLRPRIARRAVVIATREVQPGDLVCPDVVEANRDEARFQLTGPITSHHLAFNIGARYCSGAPLARAESEEAVTAFFHAFPRCERLDGSQPPKFQGFLFLGFSPVHVQLAPGRTGKP